MPPSFPAFKYFSLLFIILLSHNLSAASDDFQEYLIKLPSQASLKKQSVATLKAYLGLSESVQMDQVLPVQSESISGWYILRSDSTNILNVADLYARGRILQYQENHILSVSDADPNDSLFTQQWYHQTIQTSIAWSQFSPKNDVILAIIDTGVDYLHPDLQESLWINSAEDINSNGVWDEADHNLLDDDNNGYIDDVIGWDFTDAPRYRDLGDYKDPDNDPMDEYYLGHGTQVAGIIGAGIDNETGISGIVPGIRIMNLRAGTSQGFLEEDDVARAIMYAIENGARIINMSFGDIVVSPFLGDVIRHAYSKNVIMVSSAGNSGSNEIHYPAGFPETISVGATRETDYLAEFSTRGATVDMVAPGANILSTSIGNSYNIVNGTSFSAPMVAAGAAFLLAEGGNLSAEEVRNILKTTSKDLGNQGWDPIYGAGRLDLKNLIENELVQSLIIHHPRSGGSIAHDMLDIIVTVQDPDLRYVHLDFGIGQEPDTWESITTQHPYQIINDTLAVMPIADFPDTILTIRLMSENWQGDKSEYRSVFYLDRSAPVLSELVTTELVFENRNAILIEFRTNEATTGELYYRNRGSTGDFKMKNLTYETVNHKILIDALDITGEVEYYFIFRNRAGLITQADNNQSYYNIYIPGNMIDNQPLQQTTGNVPPGFALSQVTDLDRDGLDEIVISAYDENHNSRPVQVYEFDGLNFNKIFETPFPAIPRAYGDADSDGKMELFTGYGTVSQLLEVTETEPLTMETVRLDTGLWATEIADMDADGRSELIMRYDKEYRIFENTGDNKYQEVFRLENPSEGFNSLGPPQVKIDDLDGDGKNEIIFGDYDGDVIIYENIGDDQYTWRHTERLAFNDATNFLITGKFSSSENPILIAGTHTNDNVDYEHEFDARYWQFSIIKDSAGIPYKNTQTISLYGYSDLRTFDSGFSSGILNSSGKNYLILAPFPNLYLYEYVDDLMKPVWHTETAQTNTIIVHDFDKNGVNEFYYNDGTGFKGFVLSNGERPVPPVNFSSYPVDTASVFLDWHPAEQAEYYRIYRGNSALNLTIIDSVANQTSYTDTTVLKDSTYYYSAQVIDYSFPITASHLAPVRKATPNSPPRVDSIIVSAENQLQIYYNEILKSRSFHPENFSINSGEITASSAISFLNNQACLVSFNSPFENQQLYMLEMSDIFDTNMTLIDKESQELQFYYQEFGDSPYIEKWNFAGNRIVDLHFNMPMDTSSALNPINFQISPQGSIKRVDLLDENMKNFRLYLSENTYTGASGVTSYLECNNLRNIQGRKFVDGNKINLIKTPDNIDAIFVFPQPANLNGDWIGFGNINKLTQIIIFDIQGRKIVKLSETDSNGGIRWDLKNENGQKISAGVYFFHARSGDQTKIGKFTVVK